MSELWTPDRRPSLTGRLARLGFTDATRAQRLLADSEAWQAGDVGDTLIDALGGTADPDLALDGLLRLLERLPDPTPLLNALDEDGDLQERLLTVLGVSAALGDHLARHPQDWTVLQGSAALVRPSAGQLREELPAWIRAK